MAIRMSGMISGLDTESIVKSLMETQQAKKTKIESKKQKLEWKQEIWSGLNTKMYSFYKDYAGKLRFQSNYQTKKATSSDSTKVTVSANSSATKGTYRVNVKSLAAAQYVTSAKISSYETTNDQGEKITNKVTSSTKLSDLGMTADGTKQIQIKTADQTVSMTVNADTTISDFVDNLKSAGLNASFDEGQGRFFIGAKDSGLDQKFEIKMTAFTQEQLNAQQTVNNAVKYDSLTAAQKNSVLDVLASIQNDTSSDKIDSAVASLMEVSDAQAKSEVTGYYRNQIVTELETKYFQKDENGNNVITDAAKQALINAGKLEEKDDASHTQEELVTLAKLGKDLFVAANVTSNQQFQMTEFLYNAEDTFYYYNGSKVFDSNKQQAYRADGYQFETVAGETNYYNLKDKNGNIVEKVFIPDDDNNIFSFHSSELDNTDENAVCSYYNMSILNFHANDDIVKNGRMLACSAENTEGLTGWEESKNLTKMLALQTDNSMFKQGDPGSFLNVLCTAVLGVDSARVTAATENAQNILDAVDHRRTSISGVDEDEEGQNLVIYQNLLHYQYRVLSIMNEALDKLINGTAV